MSTQFHEATPHPAAPTREEPLYAFRSRRGALHGLGRGAMLPRGSVSTLEDRLARFFRHAGDGAVIAGALPFDRTAEDYLWQAGRTLRSPLGAARSRQEPLSWRTRQEPPASAYADAVARAIDMMIAEAGTPEALEKIVLARTLVASADRPIDLLALLSRLSGDSAVTAFLVPLPEHGGVARSLVGATPELLLSKSGSRITSHPLAGSAKRRTSLAEDAAAAAGLNASEKDRREHRIVVEFILDMLTPYCSRLLIPEGTTITSTSSMWHLGTRIEGELKDADMPSAAVAALLHPTPAVCGLPRERAASLIAELEPQPRDFYAGAVGWCDAQGDGAWYVTIRCAEIAGNQARLYAGAGIVPGSDPQAEAAETGAKFGALLSALGINAEAGA